MNSENNLHKSIKFAMKAHKGQDRDGEAPLPYVTHVIDVLNKLRYIGGVTDPCILTAAILHDVLEETTATRDDISNRFGDEVLNLVIQVTRQEPNPQEKEGLTESEVYEMRTERFLTEIAAMSTEAKMIKLADRLSNIENALATRPIEKQERYLGQTVKILDLIPRETNPNLWDSVKRLTDSQLD